MKIDSLTPSVRKFSAFLAVGAAATLAQFVVLVALVELAGVSPVIASAIGYVLSALLNYTLNYYVTFSSTESHMRALPKFLGVAAIALVVNSLSLHLFLNWVDNAYVLGQVFATGMTLIWNFIAHASFTYRRSKVRAVHSVTRDPNQ